MLATAAAFTVVLAVGVGKAGAPIIVYITWTVNSAANTNDGTCNSTNCTLREAINASNASTSKFLHRIAFHIGTGVQTITLNSAPFQLPTVTHPVTIDGTSQPGPTTSNCFTELGHPCIELRGPASDCCYGLNLAVGATVQGLAINGWFAAIKAEGTGSDVIKDNYLGLAPSGSAGLHSDYGVFIVDVTNPVTIGTPGHGNVISNNFEGIRMQPTTGACCASVANVIQGNRIGTSPAGDSAIPNAYGVAIVAWNGASVGGSSSGAGNLISGNTDDGVYVFASSATIRGNTIGTNAAQNTALPNKWGVDYHGEGGTIAANLVSGNTVAGIALNGASGVTASNNLVGLDPNFNKLGNGTGIEVSTGGGNTLGPDNSIDGNIRGVELDSGTTGNLVTGNSIGTVAGAGNALGLLIDGANGNTVQGNQLSGNTTDGALLQNGAASNTLAGNYFGVYPGGGSIPNGVDGIRISSAGAGNTIGGTTSSDANVISSNGADGVQVSDSNGEIVEGNMIGTNAAGTAAMPNAVSGVAIGNGNQNAVGGAAVSAGNLISGNGTGFNAGPALAIQSGNGGTSSGNQVLGNKIGTDVNGTSAIPNAVAGVYVSGTGSTGNEIGGPNAGEGNLISGNINGFGVELTQGASGNLVRGNRIGTDASGMAALPNATGVIVDQASTGNFIGDTSAGGGNLISGNLGTGVVIQDDGTTGNKVVGNRIGTTADGTAALGNGLNGVGLLSSGNTIGGASAGNVLSGNDRGIAAANLTSGTIQGNEIGTNASGTAAIGNIDVGVRLDDSTGVTLRGNVVSGNGGNAVELNGGGSHSVQGNKIGTSINGSAAIANAEDGIDAAGSTKNVIGGTTASARNVVSGNHASGIVLEGPSATAMQNVVEGNYVGTNAAGTGALANTKMGILLSAAPGNTVGGGGSAGNLVSGNGINGIDLSGATTKGNLVAGNKVGTNATAGAKLPNGADGVLLLNAVNTTVGGSAANANVISGNGAIGIDVNGSSATGNQVGSNFIGTNSGRTLALGNSAGGVRITSSATLNTIGGTSLGNTIAFNIGRGIFVFSGTRDRISQNSIFSNTGLGIDLYPLGVNPNDHGDPDTGANNRQNYPVLKSATAGSTTLTVAGTLDSTAGMTFLLEFSASPSCNPSGFGEGRTYLGHRLVTTSSADTVSFLFGLTASVAKGSAITATATDPSGNTSEFSHCVTATLVPETLDVATTGSGSGSVTSNPAGIDCGATCSKDFDYGTTVTLTASADAGSNFSGWAGACTGTGTCSVTMSGHESVTATFTAVPKPVRCVVPRVKRKKLRAAKRAIRKHHCGVGRIRRAHSAKVRRGRVVSQKPRAGRHLHKGAKVRLVVSKGKKPKH